MGNEIQKLSVALVKDGELLRQAQCLRHLIFFGREGVDTDAFDSRCIHLVAHELHTQKAVGTYRLLVADAADASISFYAEQKFDLTNIRRYCRGKLLEMGRACVDKTYRQHLVLRLMWKELISFIETEKIRYIFGSASIDEPTPLKIGIITHYLLQNHLAPEQFRVMPREEFAYPYEKNVALPVQKQILPLLPSLIKGYLRMGAEVCGPPAWNKQLDTAVFFMLLDAHNMKASFKERFI